MSRRSTVAVSTLVPALNVLSTTLPVSTFFSVVRTKAPPLPGLTCWNAVIDHSWPSRLSTRPFFRSFVVATGGSPASRGGAGAVTRRVVSSRRTKGHRRRVQRTWGQRYRPALPDLEQLARGGGEQLGGTVPDDEGVLDPHPAAAGQVHPWFDGDGHPGLQVPRAGGPEQRGLVDLQPDPVPQAVHELLAEPRVGDDVPGGGVDGDHRRPRHQRRPARVLRLGHERVQLTLPAGGPPEDDGPGHVGVVTADERAEVHLHQVPAPQRRVGGPVVRDRRV